MAQHNRTTNVVTTATTVVALLALASVVRAAPVTEFGCTDTHPTMRESAVIRAVVVAVAAARDMFGADHTVAAVRSASCIENNPTTTAAICSAGYVGNQHLHISLDERLLDLPPPLI